MTPSAALKRLGLAPGADVASIRKAYAERFKAMDVDADPDGYARLRLARDVALRAAKAASAPLPVENAPFAVEAGDDDPVAEPAVPWRYGAPSVTLALDPGLPLLVAGQVPLSDGAPLPPQAIDAPPIAEAARRALSGPPQIASDTPPRADVTLLARPDQDMARLLHAAGNPMTDSEEAFAERCLKALLADAGAADLTRQGLVEDWLADLLAETWPRSAPLLQPTAEAFGWESERGQIRERPSIAWLNARLRGLRFQQKVTEPGHQLYKAWAELSRPGRANLLDKWRVRRADVNQLLEGVRKHFPELEAHFPPERVVSWGDGAPRSGGSFGVVRFSGFSFNFSYFIAIVVGLQVLGAVLRGISPSLPDGREGLFGPPAVTVPADPQYERIRDAAITEVFGQGRAIEWLREKQSSLASEFEARLRASRTQGRDELGAVADALEFVRLRVLLDGRNANANFLLDTSYVRLAQLDAASKQGPEFCLKVMKMEDTQKLGAPAQLRAKEQALAASMVEAGMLIAPQPPSITNADIPGALVGQVIEATGVPEKRVRQAIQNSGTPADQCKVTRALLRAALNWQGKGQLSILRVL